VAATTEAGIITRGDCLRRVIGVDLGDFVGTQILANPRITATATVSTLAATAVAAAVAVTEA